MRKTAIVLIDFDNIRKQEYRLDMDALEQAIFRAVTYRNSFDEIILRFYGGWYHELADSKSAMTIIPWIMNFPHLIVKTVINAELARSLGFESISLPYTYRIRSKHVHLRIDRSRICSDVPDCNLKNLDAILSRGTCSRLGCNKELKEAFVFDEQKLVDTMLTVDLIHYSQQGIFSIFLLSSDDDMVPAVRYSCGVGATITIIHTKAPHYKYKSEYTRGYETLIKQGWL